MHAARQNKSNTSRPSWKNPLLHQIQPQKTFSTSRDVKASQSKKEYVQMISKSDITSLLIPVYPNARPKERAQLTSEIMNEVLDCTSHGIEQIPLQEFIKKIVTNKELLSSSKFKIFYIKTLNYFLTLSEQIKDIFIKAELSHMQNNEKSESNIDWAVKSCSNETLVDPQLKADSLMSSQSSQNGYLNFISNYSYDKLKGKMQDLETAEKLRERRRSSIYTALPKEVTLISHLLGVWQSIDTIDFNIFKFKSEMNFSTNNQKLMYTITNYIFEDFDLFDHIVSKDKFSKFIRTVVRGYLNNPYHNAIHACDVLQTSMIMIKNGEFRENEYIDDLDISALFVAGIIHDIGHPALSNEYQVNNKTKLAWRYNDISPLENMHLYKGFKILSQTDTDIFEKLKSEETRLIRRRIIDMIINTDGANHSKVINTWKAKIEWIDSESSRNNDSFSCENYVMENLLKTDRKIAKFDTQQSIWNLIIHTADISNPAKIFELYKTWTDLIMEEFFTEGDWEKKKNLPVNMLCDRETTSIPKAQIGFINFIVLPAFQLVKQIIPNGSNYYLDNLKSNEEEWKAIMDHESMIQN